MRGIIVVVCFDQGNNNNLGLCVCVCVFLLLNNQRASYNFIRKRNLIHNSLSPLSIFDFVLLQPLPAQQNNSNKLLKLITHGET